MATSERLALAVAVLYCADSAATNMMSTSNGVCERGREQPNAGYCTVYSILSPLSSTIVDGHTVSF